MLGCSLVVICFLILDLDSGFWTLDTTLVRSLERELVVSSFLSTFLFPK